MYFLLSTKYIMNLLTLQHVLLSRPMDQLHHQALSDRERKKWRKQTLVILMKLYGTG